MRGREKSMKAVNGKWSHLKLVAALTAAERRRRGMLSPQVDRGTG